MEATAIYVVEPRYFDGHAKKVVPKPKRSRNHLSKKSEKKGDQREIAATITSESNCNGGKSQASRGDQDKDDEDCEIQEDSETLAVVEQPRDRATEGQQGEGSIADGDCVAMMGVQAAEKTAKDQARILPRWEEMEREEFDAVTMDWIINSKSRGVCIRKILNEYFDNPEIGECQWNQ